MNNLATELREIFPGGRSSGVYLKVREKGGAMVGFELEYGGMYDAPSVSFAQLKAVSDLFGTESIDLDDYCNGTGCDTCGYGSDYGHTIQIYDATKRVAELRSLVGRNLHEEPTNA